MSKARDLGNLLDTDGDVVSGSLDNVPTPSKTSIEALGIALPAANLTGSIANARIPAGAVTQHVTDPITKSTSRPTISTNPSGGVGTVWLRTTTGEMYCCTDATTNANVWTNIGEGSGGISPSYDIAYLVIAGGGAGGYNYYAGAGGAGGYRNSYGTELSGGDQASLTSITGVGAGNQLVITVGAGGSASTNAPANNGANSSITHASITDVVAIGGGGGGDAGNSGTSYSVGATGGSGGGSGIGAHNSAYWGPSSISSPTQGYIGGRGRGVSGSSAAGGGGGGATEAGGDAIASGCGGTGGDGGDGLSSSITGSAVTRGGGGGGGWNGCSAACTTENGGAGGGGRGGGGGSWECSGQNGTANTGGGGGGFYSGVSTSSTGGSGVVVLSIPTASFSGICTGNVAGNNTPDGTEGANTYLIFNGDGTYTT